MIKGISTLIMYYLCLCVYVHLYLSVDISVCIYIYIITLLIDSDMLIVLSYMSHSSVPIFMRFYCKFERKMLVRILHIYI